MRQPDPLSGVRSGVLSWLDGDVDLFGGVCKFRISSMTGSGGMERALPSGTSLASPLMGDVNAVPDLGEDVRLGVGSPSLISLALLSHSSCLGPARTHSWTSLANAGV